MNKMGMLEEGQASLNYRLTGLENNVMMLSVAVLLGIASIYVLEKRVNV